MNLPQGRPLEKRGEHQASGSLGAAKAGKRRGKACRARLETRSPRALASPHTTWCMGQGCRAVRSRQKGSQMDTPSPAPQTRTERVPGLIQATHRASSMLMASDVHRRPVEAGSRQEKLRVGFSRPCFRGRQAFSLIWVGLLTLVHMLISTPAVTLLILSRRTQAPEHLCSDVCVSCRLCHPCSLPYLQPPLPWVSLGWGCECLHVSWPQVRSLPSSW